MRKIQEIIFDQYGELTHEVNHTDNMEDILHKLWSISTTFSLVNTYAPVLNDYSGKNKIDKVKKVLRQLRCPTSVLTEAYWAQQWPGTILDSPGRLLIFGSTKEINYSDFIPTPNRQFWKWFDQWEDLMLFSGNRLVLYLITSEKYGEIFGNIEILNNFSLQLSNTASKVWRIAGYKLSDTLFHNLCHV